MLTQIRRFVFVALLILISFTLLRSRLRQRIQAHHKYAAQNAQEPEKVVTHHANASTFEHFGTLDEEWEGAPRLIQVSAQYGSKMDLLYERGLRSHVKYGEKWGYPTHYLRQDIIGKGDFGDGMFNKLLFLQTIMVTELIKPFGKRAEWLASVITIPYIMRIVTNRAIQLVRCRLHPPQQRNTLDNLPPSKRRRNVPRHQPPHHQRLEWL